jgi:hypothetical protein
MLVVFCFVSVLEFKRTKNYLTGMGKDPTTLAWVRADFAGYLMAGPSLQVGL